MLSPVVIELACLYVEVTLFGAYTLLFIFCMWLIRKRRSFHALLSLAAIVSYTLSASYVILDAMRAATSYTIDSSIPGTVTYTPSFSNPLIYPLTYIIIFEFLIADAILIWRCYAVWGHNIHVCLVPILLWICTGIGGCGSALNGLHAPKSGLIGYHAQTWTMLAIVGAISMNVLTTTLIAGRILWLKRDIRNAFGEGARHMAYYDRVVAIVVESGVVYTTALISELILYRLKQTGTRLVFAVLSQLTGIVPTVIIIYAALGKITETTARTSAHSHAAVHSLPLSQLLSQGPPIARNSVTIPDTTPDWDDTLLP